jgi:hypothetical protein
MMKKPSFNQCRKLLTDAGFEVCESRNREGFGSWVIVIRMVPRHQIVWDGRDEWLVLERETQRKFAGLNEWKTLWLDRELGEQSLHVAVEKLRERVHPRRTVHRVHPAKRKSTQGRRASQKRTTKSAPRRPGG